MNIILVDEQDNKIGEEEKLSVHKSGKLHRAFSVFVFNSKNELLLQKRASNKYHCAGLWSNTCCSHPITDNILKEAEKRLKEEMGFATTLTEIFSFSYRAEFDNGLIEHEYDHVFIGYYEHDPKPNPDEVEAWSWVSIEKLKKKIVEHPNKYTPWLKISLDRVINIKKSG